MTDIERLRELLAEAPRYDAYIDGPQKFKAATFLRAVCDALPGILADYERLRGMEERVRGAPTGTLTMDAHPWLTVDDADVPPEWEGQTVALVPVTGGEGK